MMIRPPTPIPGLKTIKTAGPGSLISMRSIEHRDRDGTKTTIHAPPATVTKIPQGELQGPLGISGLGFGLTIPGPEKTYTTVRIDCYVYLPHEASDDAARAALKRASALVQERIEIESQEANEFFAQYRK